MDFFCPLCNSSLQLNSINEIFECTTCLYQKSIENKVIYCTYINMDNKNEENTITENNSFISMNPYRRIFIQCKQCNHDIGIFKTETNMRSSIYCEKCNFLFSN